MKALEALFGQSPFSPLQTHMAQVGACVEAVKAILKEFPQPLEWMEKKAKEVSDLEHVADLTKTQIKRNLGRTIFLPVDREMIIQILSFQDGIADSCERLAQTLSFHTLTSRDGFKQSFDEFSQASFDTFDHAKALVQEYDALVSSAFGGCEAARVDWLVEEVAICQHQCHQKEYELMRALYQQSSQMHYAEFHLWQSVIKQVSSVAFQSEKLVYRIRRMLEKR